MTDQPRVDGPAEAAVRFLWKLSSEYPQYPTVSLFRCWELALFSRLSLPGPALDLGCGDGRIAGYLRAAGEPGALERLAGLEISPESAQAAARRGFHDHVVRADARTIPFRSGVFGSVLSVCVVEHIPQVEEALAEVARVLRPGGLFAFSVPTPLFLQAAARAHPETPEQYAETVRTRTELVNTWDACGWAGALERAGMRVSEVTGFMPPETAQAWFDANDWVSAPIRGRGLLYRAAGPQLRRFGLGGALARYWFRRLKAAAAGGVSAPVDEAAAILIVAQRS